MMKTHISIFYFLQFAVWGCYLTSLGQLLGANGLGADISWFYATIGIVSLIMPALIGYLSDRYVSPRSLLALCHAGAALCMGSAWWYAATHPMMEFLPMFSLYLGFISLFLPTIALSNTYAFHILRAHGQDTLRAFPKVRVWGTVGFVAAMWFVNSFYYVDGSFGFTLSDAAPFGRFRLQYTSGQLLAAALTGVVTSLMALTLPNVATGIHNRSAGKSSHNLIEILGWKRFGLLANRKLRLFMLFAILAGVCLQISNGYVTPFVTHFSALPQFAGNAAAANATMLFSISQIAEALCVLIVGVALRRCGIKAVLAMALAAWALRFGTLACGDTAGGLWLLIISMIAYGVAFDFFNIAGALYVDRMTDTGIKGFGQGVLMLMSNGIGATIGMFAAGKVVNHFCHWQRVMTPDGPIGYFMGNWSAAWWIFAAYSALVCLLIILLFRERHANPLK